jgi:hypothetical protein
MVGMYFSKIITAFFVVLGKYENIDKMIVSFFKIPFDKISYFVELSSISLKPCLDFV